MKHLELHIIQSVPVTCLNRDDLGSPKTATFGGTLRARVSSQSWKRAVREMAKEIKPELFQGERTKLIYPLLFNELVALGMEEELAKEGAMKLVKVLAGVDSKSKDVVKAQTLYFLSPLEIKTLAQAYIENQDAKKSLKTISAKSINDAADISLFGRMVASDHSLTVEAASMFTHAISTHKVDMEYDYFSAVDDLQPDADSGAAHLGSLDYNSATYYRFVAINLDMLADENHLESLSLEERKEIVRIFIEATIKSIPGARKNTMNGNTLPSFVLGVVREKGHPVQLINAFEKPIQSSDKGYVGRSIDEMIKKYEFNKDTWGDGAICEQSIPNVSLEQFLEEMVANVC